MFQALIFLALFQLGLSEKNANGFPKVHPPHKVPGSRIIGGDAATPHAYPYQVGLSINGGTSFCGGSLISQNYVLTAAHCAVAISTVDVILGAHNLTANETTRIILKGSEILIHDQYDSFLHRNDIALIRLSEPVNSSWAIQTIRLPASTDSAKTYENLFAFATGWGLLKDTGAPSTKDLSDVLQVVTVPVMNLGVCGEYFNDPDAIYVASSNLCTSGYRNKGTCKGDSGGPLMYNEVLIGISSVGTDDCEECYPSIYARVGAYLDWIQEHSDVQIQA